MSVMLGKGDACLPCRQAKKRCDGMKPVCPRCLRRSKQCVYASGIVRRQTMSLIERLEAHTLKLESTIRRLIIASRHDVSLISRRLLRRIERLGRTNVPIPCTVPTWLPAHLSPVHGQLESSFTGLEELPFPISNYLINLFLSYKTYFFFPIDSHHFLTCVSLPPSHPESIHPCLLNACYLGASIINRESLAYLQPYFVKRTRHFLQQALMFVDRIPHFLLASTILGSHFTTMRRLEEAFAVISGAAHIASACQLVRDSNLELGLNQSLLSPPKDDLDRAERARLARTIYITDQSFAVVSGYPMTFAGDNRWDSSEVVHSEDQNGNNIVGEAVLGFGQSDEVIMVAVLKVFERVKQLALMSCENGVSANEELYITLRERISFFLSVIPPLADPRQSQSSNPYKAFALRTAFARTTLNGSELILHSLRAGVDPEARNQMVGSVRDLLDNFSNVRELRRLRKSRVRGSLMSMVHVMNAISIIAYQLRRHAAQQLAKLAADDCHLLDMLLECLEDSSMGLTEWSDTHIVIKDSLITVVKSLAD
ncbi:hypothetical protein DL93DRAFT_2161545 [Clavulina sp. PMI_390]|nr:hypothetical protein DL93DRAFT_2161545 [Clavulina sp. PMI_390]